MAAPRIVPSGARLSLRNLPKRDELPLSVVRALPKASSTSPARTTDCSSEFVMPSSTAALPPPPPPPPGPGPGPPLGSSSATK